MAKFQCSLYAIFVVVVLVVCAEHSCAHDTTRPNIVWIIADDLSPDLGCYGTKAVSTPNIDRLAKQGTRFTHMFATSPVCSPSRTSLVTGSYQTTIGGHHHRTRLKPILPLGHTVMEVFHKKGYYVTNSGWPLKGKRGGKTDYNFETNSKLFDGNDWRNRSDGQPFFSQIQVFEPHRRFVKDTNTDRAQQLKFPPVYPDHPVTRADWANYLATVEVLDRKVGEVISRLKEDGLLESTMIFFFADHGRPHAWGKQWLYDGGLRIPLIIRWPKNFKAGVVDDRLLSMIDIAPTSLHAAGIDVPKFMQGLSFWDKQSPGREAVFAARDRCGDAVDRIRAIRSRDFKYIRNFMPERPYMQQSGYKTAQYPVITLFKVLHKKGELTDAQSRFMASIKPAEELYDLKNDPFELHNLANSDKHQEYLIQCRNKLSSWQKSTRDLGIHPEGDAEFMTKLMKDKQAYFARTMMNRGLSVDITPAEYLAWWEQELGLKPKAP